MLIWERTGPGKREWRCNEHISRRIRDAWCLICISGTDCFFFFLSFFLVFVCVGMFGLLDELIVRLQSQGGQCVIIVSVDSPAHSLESTIFFSLIYISSCLIEEFNFVKSS